MAENVKVLATNRKAGFEYFLLEKFEAGLALQGSEIKSIRAGQVSIQEAFVDIENGEQAWLVDAHMRRMSRLAASTTSRAARGGCSCIKNRSVSYGTMSVSRA